MNICAYAFTHVYAVAYIHIYTQTHTDTHTYAYIRVGCYTRKWQQFSNRALIEKKKIKTEKALTHPGSFFFLRIERERNYLQPLCNLLHLYVRMREYMRE